MAAFLKVKQSQKMHEIRWIGSSAKAGTGRKQASELAGQQIRREMSNVKWGRANK